MAKRKPSSPGNVTEQGLPAQPANERVGAVPASGLTIGDIAIPTFHGAAAQTEHRTHLVEAHESEISQTDAQQLMANVQAAQRNLTETLNSLSKYRKTVARILEQRRREAAMARKASGLSGEGVAPVAIPEEEFSQES